MQLVVVMAVMKAVMAAISRFARPLLKGCPKGGGVLLSLSITATRAAIVAAARTDAGT